MQRGEGRIILSLNVSYDSIQILYYDEKVKDRVLESISEFVEDIFILRIDKKDFEQGYHLSKSYRDKLKDKNITLIRYAKKHSNTPEFYICGKNDERILIDTLEEIKRQSFTWLTMYEYQNTRSYRAIFQKIFSSELFKKFIMENYSALSAEVACETIPNFYFPSNGKYKKMNMIMSLVKKDKPIHQ